MSNNVLVLDGLAELRAALLALPSGLTDEAGRIVTRAAEQVGGEVRLNYPHVTGTLKRRVTVTVEANRFGAGAIVKSGAPHASLYEYGSNPRRNGKGANRGRMPQGPTDSRVIPRAIRTRAKMTDQLVELVRSAGFEVTR
jgi:hypothetical protein